MTATRPAIFDLMDDLVEANRSYQRRIARLELLATHYEEWFGMECPCDDVNCPVGEDRQ
jgi:hypothetical protein